MGWWWSGGFLRLGHSWWALTPWQPLSHRRGFCREMAGLHGGTVPTNGGCAKHDVMCADHFPLLTEDRCWLFPQRREPGATLPSHPGCLGRCQSGRGFPLCCRQGGQSERTILLTLSRWGSWALSTVSVLCVPLAPLRWTEEVARGPLVPRTLHILDPRHVGDKPSCLFGPSSRRERD